MLHALRDSKVVENIVDVIQSGYVDIPVVTLSDNALKAFETIDGFNNLRGVDNHAV